MSLDPPVDSARDYVPLVRRRRFMAGAFVVVVALLSVGWFLGYLAQQNYDFSAENVRDDIRGLGPWGHVMFVVVMTASVIFSPIPNLPVLIGGGLAYGVVLGTVYALIGLTVGGAAAFWIARKGGRRFLARFTGEKAAAQIDAVASARTGGWIIFWGRMLPMVAGDWVSYAAGLTSIRFPIFLVATFFGSIAPTAVAVGAGDQLDERWWITALVVGAVVLGIAISSGYFFWRRRRLRRRAREMELRASAKEAEAMQRRPAQGERRA